MSMWQWQAAVNGYIAANSGKSGKLSEAEKDELFDWIDAATAPLVLTTETYALNDDGALVPAGTTTFNLKGI